ncbi:MAG: hypothetical protein BWY71_02172 [Planctomycetes bacterium ADurb.Bin412]|nr:MAG: hypothetical protein BWY71_02172 [Planctomycetes bacterium ADurb.Bin412]
MKLKSPAAFSILGNYAGSNYIRRHQVRGELHPFEVQGKHLAQGLHQHGLPQTGNSLQENIPPGQQGNKAMSYYLLLPHHYLCYFSLDLPGFIYEFINIHFLAPLVRYILTNPPWPGIATTNDER